MGGTVIRIEGFPQTTEWGAHSLPVADFMMLKDIELTREGRGDNADGEIVFDPDKRQITVDTIYFSMPKKALMFWRGIGFDVIFKTTRKQEE